jgi:hypothetical protein
MKSRFGRIPGLWMAGLAVVGLGLFSGCLGDSGNSGSDTGGSGGTPASTGGGGSGGSGPSSTGGSGPAGTACAAPIVLSASHPGIADFDSYDGTELTNWSFALGGDSSTGLIAGPFGYGDNYDSDPEGKPEYFQMVDGNDSMYALSISDSLSEEYGGGMGIWISDCLNATAFSGLSFWVRGNSPTGDAKVSLMMQETTADMPATADAKIGTCPGTDDQCAHPSYVFPVTADWTEIQIPWGSFTAGSSRGTAVVPDGRNVWQVQYDIGLVWADDGTGTYAPTPAEYELVIDDIAFY